MSSTLGPPSDPARNVLILSKGLADLRADRLDRWQAMSTEQERTLAELGKGEILDGLANKAGKTDLLAAVFTSLAQGREHLGGFRLPAIPQPSEWVISSLDFTQQQLSVQPKFVKYMGSWPHKPRKDGETLRSLRVKYIGCRSDDPSAWSRITFISAKNQQSGTGFRGNGYGCDEPPPMWLLRELRKMGDAGQIVIGIIAATMIYRSQWQPLREDYPLSHEGKWHGRFLRLRGPAFNPDDLDDTTVGNRALTREDKEDLLAKYATDPHRDARILGKEIDTSGANPLRAVLEEVQRQHDAARDGEFSEWKVSREVPTREGKQLVTEIVDVESWEDTPIAGHVYRVFLDTSLGIADGAHDPGMAQVVDMTAGAQVSRYEGFVGEYGLGVLGGGLSKKWSNALVSVGTTGGYGDTCLSGLRAVGCKHIESRQVKGGDGVVDRTDLGNKETEATRGVAFGALREMFLAASLGHAWFTIRSRADLAQMIDLSTDEKGRIIRVPGVHHGESVTLLGRAASLCAPEQRRRSIPLAAQKLPESPVDVERRNMGLPPRRRDPLPQRPRRSMRWR